MLGLISRAWLYKSAASVLRFCMKQRFAYANRFFKCLGSAVYMLLYIFSAESKFLVVIYSFASSISSENRVSAIIWGVIIGSWGGSGGWTVFLETFSSLSLNLATSGFAFSVGLTGSALSGSSGSVGWSVWVHLVWVPGACLIASGPSSSLKFRWPTLKFFVRLFLYRFS